MSKNKKFFKKFKPKHKIKKKQKSRIFSDLDEIFLKDRIKKKIDKLLN
jgi:hypothetical protein